MNVNNGQLKNTSAMVAITNSWHCPFAIILRQLLPLNSCREGWLMVADTLTND